MLTIKEKFRPVYRLSDGRLYVKVPEREAKRRTDSERVVLQPNEKWETEVLWFLPIAGSRSDAEIVPT